MSYRCGICRGVVSARKPRQVHQVFRTRPYSGPKEEKTSRTEIEREIPVCEGCSTLLAAGMPLNVMLRKFSQPATPPPAPEPAKISTTPPPVYRPVALAIGSIKTTGKTNRK